MSINISIPEHLASKLEVYLEEGEVSALTLAHVVINDKTEELERLRSEFASFRASSIALETHEKITEGFKRSNLTYQGVVDSLKGDVADKIGDVATLKKRFKELHMRWEDSEVLLARKTAENKNLNIELEEMATELKGSKAKLSESNKIRDKLSNRNQQNISKINKLEESLKKVGDKNKAISDSEASILIAQATEELQAENDRLTTLNKETAEKNIALIQRLDEVEVLLNQVADSADSAIKMNNQKIAAFDNVIAELADKTETLVEEKRRVIRANGMNEMLGSFMHPNQDAIDGRLNLLSLYPLDYLEEIGLYDESMKEKDHPYPFFLYRDINGKMQVITVDKHDKLVAVGEKRRLSTLIAEEENVKKMVTFQTVFTMQKDLSKRMDQVKLDASLTYLSSEVVDQVRGTLRFAEVLNGHRCEFKSKITELMTLKSKATLLNSNGHFAAALGRASKVGGMISKSRKSNRKKSKKGKRR